MDRFRTLMDSLKRTTGDPLLTAATVMMVIALVGVVLAMAATVVGVLALVATGLPFGAGPADPAWRPFGSLVLGLIALGVIAGGIGNVLSIIATVADGEPFAPANAARIERLGWRVIELFAIGWFSALIDAPVGGDINGFDISLDTGGGNALAFALVLFVLARVFRHGNRLTRDLEGTV